MMYLLAYLLVGTVISVIVLFTTEPIDDKTIINPTVTDALIHILIALAWPILTIRALLSKEKSE